MPKQYRCIEDLEVRLDHYGETYGHGTVKKGDVYTLLKEPDPKKKLYRLRKESDFTDEYVLSVRKSVLKKYFEEIVA